MLLLNRELPVLVDYIWLLVFQLEPAGNLADGHSHGLFFLGILDMDARRGGNESMG